MNQGFEIDPSQLILNETVFQGSSTDAHFIHQLHEKYGIPLVQLERVYLSAKSMRSSSTQDTSDLDYGQKLTLNHNILKEMISIIDTRTTSNQIQFSQTRPTRRSNFHTEPRKVDGNLRQLKDKLQDLLSLISQQSSQSSPIQIKKVVNLSDINQGSYYNASLQYSKDYPEQPSIKQQKRIVIDRKKLDEAKEVTSQFMLNQSTPESLKMSHERQTLLKSSLDRISEVQSGETIEKQAQKRQQKTNPAIMSQESISVRHSQQLEDHAHELDETGKIILSTINKKITKTLTAVERQKEESKKSLPAKQSDVELKDEIRKSRFWKNGSGKLSTLAHNFAISHESIESPKAFQRSRFRFDHFNNGFTFKSLNSIDREHSNQQSRKHYTIEANQNSRVSKTHFSQQKPLRSSDFIGKPNKFQSNEIVPKKNADNKPFTMKANQKFNESFVSAFPSQQLTVKQSLIRPQTQEKGQYIRATLSSSIDQTYKRISMSNQRHPQAQIAASHFLQQKRKPQIAFPPTQISIRPQSVPHLANQPNIHSQNSPIFLHENQLYRSASTQLMQTRPTHISYNYQPSRIVQTEAQTSKIGHPYQRAVETLNRPSGPQSSVYYNIYDDIVKNSSASSQQSGNAKFLQNPLVMTFNPSLNDNKLRKKGIMLTNNAHHSFSRRAP